MQRIGTVTLAAPPARVTDTSGAGDAYAAGFLAGSLAEQRRRCGKEGCRCAQGELHGPYAYLSVAGRMVYVPAVLGEAVRARLQESARLREVLEEISAVNLELLARRELD